MAKRRANADSDDENVSVDGSPVSKRARTADSDDERAPPASSKRASKGKGKARRKDDDDESESDNDVDDSEEADRKFEEENEERIRAVLENRRKVHGVSSPSPRYMRRVLILQRRVLLTTVLSRPSKCTNLCATSTSHSLLGPRLTSLSVRF